MAPQLISYDVLWDLGALESKNVHLKVLFALDIFIRKRKLCFGKTYASDEPRISKQKRSYRTKKLTLLAFLEYQKKLSQPREPP